MAEWRWNMIALTAGMLIYPAYLGARARGFWEVSLFAFILGLCFAYITRGDTSHIPRSARVLFSLVWCSFLVAVAYGAGRLIA